MLVKYGYLSIRNSKKREHEHGLFVGNRLEKFISSFAFVSCTSQKRARNLTQLLFVLRFYVSSVTGSRFSVHVAVYLILNLPRKKKILNFSFIFYCYVAFLF